MESIENPHDLRFHVPHVQGPLTFCAMRVALDELGISMPSDGGDSPPLELPLVVSRKLYEIIAITAMQFRGYIFKVNEPQARRT